MPEGTWLAVTLRRPANRERKRYTPWLAHRMGTAVPTHHSLSPSAVVATITAGGESRDQVRSLLSQVTAGLPGFDLDTQVRFASRHHPAVLGLPAGVLLAVATIFGMPYLPAQLAAHIPSFLPQAVLGLSAAAVLAGLAALSGKLRSPEVKQRQQLAAAAFPAPARRAGRPRPPRKEHTVKGHTKVNGEKVPYERLVRAFDGDYPLAPTAFLVSPNVVAGIVSPHAGAISGAATTKARATPPALHERIGPMLGTNDDGDAHLSADAMRFGLACLGQPGSGKSLFVRSLFGWHCLERVSPSGRPGHPGTQNALIAFENKGDGAGKYVRWAHALGDKVLTVDVADPATPAIDLFAIPGDNAAKAVFSPTR